MSVILGFDMGIRNLAYCLVQHESDKAWNILHWDNVDLLEGGVSSQSAKKCIGCDASASWISHADGKKWCKACATRVRVKKSAREKPEFPTLTCALTVTALRALATEAGVADVKKMKKADLIAWASSRYLLPWKPAKAMDASLSSIRSSMDKWLDGMLPAFSSATLIRLENQPVMKGPTMKSVQMILYTLLAHRLEREYKWSGRIEFVHAGVKSRNTVKATEATEATEAAATEATDSKAYRARKVGAETDTVRLLTERGGALAERWLPYFQSKTKKSDLADAFLMAHRSA
jgi:hypothetical protein